MARTIRLEYPAKCKDCGTELPAGSEARYYGRGNVYGVKCHPDRRAPKAERQRPEQGHAPDLDRLIENNTDDRFRSDDDIRLSFEYGTGRW